MQVAAIGSLRGDLDHNYRNQFCDAMHGFIADNLLMRGYRHLGRGGMMPLRPCEPVLVSGTLAFWLALFRAISGAGVEGTPRRIDFVLLLRVRWLSCQAGGQNGERLLRRIRTQPE